MRFITAQLDRALFAEWKATPEGLAAFRIFFGVGALVFIGRPYVWVTEMPAGLFQPPFGPLRLLPGLPPDWVVHALSWLIGMSLIALILGYRTTLASWTTSLAWLFLAGVSFSFGKIDHVVLPVLVPAIFAHSGWGAVWSLDRIRGRMATVRSWPFALLAVSVGVAMAYAAVAKVTTGWLHPGSQAVLGHLTQNIAVHGRDAYLANQAVAVDNTLVWELADWLTVIFEASLLLFWLRRATTRMWAYAATGFHLGVLLTFNIPFVGNLLAYAAWLPWTQIAASLHARRHRWVLDTYVLGWITFLVLGLALYSGIVVGVGAFIVANVVLTLTVYRWLRGRRTLHPTSAIDVDQPPSPSPSRGDPPVTSS